MPPISPPEIVDADGVDTGGYPRVAQDPPLRESRHSEAADEESSERLVVSLGHADEYVGANPEGYSPESAAMPPISPPPGVDAGGYLRVAQDPPLRESHVVTLDRMSSRITSRIHVRYPRDGADERDVLASVGLEQRNIIGGVFVVGVARDLFPLQP